MTRRSDARVGVWLAAMVSPTCLCSCTGNGGWWRALTCEDTRCSAQTSKFYNIPGWSSIGTDILAVASALPFLAIFIFLPFIPGLRNIPRWIPFYKVIWRSYYKKYGSSMA